MQSSVRTSQETHYVSATKTNRLMLFREIIAVYCENHTEHTNALCGQNGRIILTLNNWHICHLLSLWSANSISCDVFVSSSLIWSIHYTWKEYKFWSSLLFNFLQTVNSPPFILLFLSDWETKTRTNKTNSMQHSSFERPTVAQLMKNFRLFKIHKVLLCLH
jgi:hypothetical protein